MNTPSLSLTQELAKVVEKTLHLTSAYAPKGVTMMLQYIQFHGFYDLGMGLFWLLVTICIGLGGSWVINKQKKNSYALYEGGSLTANDESDIKFNYYAKYAGLTVVMVILMTVVGSYIGSIDTWLSIFQPQLELLRMGLQVLASHH